MSDNRLQKMCIRDSSIAVQADRIIRLEDGRVVYDGDAHAPEAVVQPTLLPDEEEKA